MGRELSVAVLVKQVPLLDEKSDPLRLGPDGRLVREGIELEINPFCRRAITKGIELSSESGGRCRVFSLGPPSANEVLREALAAGADDAVLVTDPAFAGSDTLATARALAAALVRFGPFDLVLTGLNSVDGDTGQVGPELAELLELPFVSGIRELELLGEHLSLTCERDDGLVEAAVDLPAVLSVAERLTYPAKQGPEERTRIEGDRITRLSAVELGSGPWGEEGSPTKVGQVRIAGQARLGVRLSGSLETQIATLVECLGQRGALSGLAASPTAEKVPETMGPPAVLVALEPGRSQLARELLGTAALLAHRLSGRVVAFQPLTNQWDEAAGLPAGEGLFSALGSFGADEVVALRLADGHEAGAEELAGAFRDYLDKGAMPEVFLAPSTAFGREAAARFAASCEAGLTGDAIAVEIAGGRLLAWKPAFGGALEAAISADSRVQGATVRPGALPLLEPRSSNPARRIAVVRRRTRVEYRRKLTDDAAGRLGVVPALVGVGAGVDPGSYPRLEPLLEVLGAEMVATRKVTDKGWLPRTRQVGLTGIHVCPSLYLAVGISGRVNHLVGLRRAGTIVAINNDSNARIFEAADYGLLGDWRELVPVLVRALKRDVPQAGRNVGREVLVQ